MGSGSEIRWDKQALDRAVKDFAKKGTQEIAAQMQRIIDSVSRGVAGKSVAEIAVVLQREMSRIEVKFTDPELTQYAEAISEGRRIVIQPEEIR